MFKKILVANRGEIAVRVIRACREMGIKTVAIYSSADRKALHTRMADESICVGREQLRDSYLNMERILSAAYASGADAIHPGYGFLSENSRFARMCEKCKITFIGPSSEVIERMGNKSEARKTMSIAGIPVIPGALGFVTDSEKAKISADKIGYPVIIKAILGGGGRGMRIVHSPHNFVSDFSTAQKESQNAFGDSRMYIERYIEGARHIEVQIIADKYGNTIQLGERDCSIQKKHQKIIEESPSTAINKDLRAKIGKTAVKAAEAAKYDNIGTIEFLLTNTGEYFFMEMNTRIQVEHPVTEMISGFDLVHEQIQVAAGERLSLLQEDVILQGHSIECRVNVKSFNSSDSDNQGKIKKLYIPGGKGVRIDTDLFTDYKIPPYYDSLILKLIVHDKDRVSAISKMNGALEELVIEGIETNIDFLKEILRHENFLKEDISTDFIEKFLDKR